MLASPSNLSVVIPFHNEAACVSFVLREVRALLPDAEIIAVDDGSTDATWDCICREHVRGLRLSTQTGQSGAMYHGLLACTRDWCGLMDGDGQNDPSNFLILLEELRKGNADVVCGYRKTRRDKWSKKVSSRVANSIRRMFLHDGVRDTGCSQKLFPRSAVPLLVPFQGLHRYLPTFFMKAGLRVCEVEVTHRPRHAGVSKYGNWARAVSGIHDLIGVRWLLKRRVIPCRVEFAAANPIAGGPADTTISNAEHLKASTAIPS